MTPVLECVIVVSIIVFIIVLVVIAVFLIKFLQEITLTLSSIRELTDITKNEIKPALKSLNNILATVNNVSNATNKQFSIIKKILTALFGASCLAFGKTKNQGGFFSGLISGFNIFRKKGDKKCQ